jgi:hypothetical protein
MSKINKNGKPRKVGSGRTKGASSLVSVKLSELIKKFGNDDLIVCGRVFLRDAGIGDTQPAIKSALSDEEKSGIQVVEV